MARWLAMTLFALGLAAVPARAQVFKPRDGSKTTDKSADKSTDTSDKSDTGKKVAKKPDSASHAAPKHARHPAHHGDDPDFVKITDDDD